MCLCVCISISRFLGLHNITIKAASIVEPLGFSGSLSIMFFCVIYYVTLFRQIKMFCSLHSIPDSNLL